MIHNNNNNDKLNYKKEASGVFNSIILCAFKNINLGWSNHNKVNDSSHNNSIYTYAFIGVSISMKSYQTSLCQCRIHNCVWRCHELGRELAVQGRRKEVVYVDMSFSHLKTKILYYKHILHTTYSNESNESKYIPFVKMKNIIYFNISSKLHWRHDKTQSNSHLLSKERSSDFFLKLIASEFFGFVDLPNAFLKSAFLLKDE